MNFLCTLFFINLAFSDCRNREREAFKYTVTSDDHLFFVDTHETNGMVKISDELIKEKKDLDDEREKIYTKKLERVRTPSPPPFAGPLVTYGPGEEPSIFGKLLSLFNPGSREFKAYADLCADNEMYMFGSSWDD